jgi:hypothetical protein
MAVSVLLRLIWCDLIEKKGKCCFIMQYITHCTAYTQDEKRQWVLRFLDYRFIL